MAQVFKISEAASLAIHTMVILAESPGMLRSTKSIAQFLGVSEAHLSKVLQRLTKAGMVTAIRGPRGGFKLEKKASNVRLLEIYEVIEGELEEHTCLLDTPVCIDNRCILGNLLVSINNQIREYFTNTRLNELAKTCKFNF